MYHRRIPISRKSRGGIGGIGQSQIGFSGIPQHIFPFRVIDTEMIEGGIGHRHPVQGEGFSQSDHIAVCFQNRLGRDRDGLYS